MIRLRDIKAEQARLESRKQRYLQQNGWSQTSNTPGCYWIWYKFIDGTRYTANNIESAMLIQEHAYDGWKHSR